MCEADTQNISPAVFASLLEQHQKKCPGPVTITFSSSPDRGPQQYGERLKELFPPLPKDPQQCVRLIRDASAAGIINVAVAGGRDVCSCLLEATISLASRT